MAAEPKQKRSKVRTRTRRSHHAKTLPNLSACPQCKALRVPHRVCPECGFYRGRKILELRSDKRLAMMERRAAAQKIKEEKAKKAKPARNASRIADAGGAKKPAKSPTDNQAGKKAKGNKKK